MASTSPTSGLAPMNPQRRDFLLGSLLLVCLSLHANCAWNGFVYDDHSQIELNPYVHSFKHAGELLRSSIAVQQGKQAWANSYRPLVNLSFLTSFELFGYSPYGYHLINIFLHLIVVGLIFVVTAKVFSNEWLGLLAAAVFALHPIHTEPVAWIDGISDPLFSVFYLLAFWFYLRLGEAQAESRIRLRVGMIVSFFLALLSKETAMSFPVLVTVYEHFFRPGASLTPWTRKLSRYAWIWITHAVYLSLRASALGRLFPPPMHPDLSRREVFFTALSLVGEYAKALVWPVPLVAFAPFRPSSSFNDSYVLAGLFVCAVSLLAFVYLWKHSRLYSFAFVWMLLTIAPALNARFMAANVYAERYLYMPSLGFCWLVAGGLLWLWRGTTLRPVFLRWALVGVSVALALSACREIVARNREWKNDQTLTVSILKARPDASNARRNYGVNLWYTGDHEEAERQWVLALQYNPDTVEAISDLGMAKLEEKRYPEAIAYLQRAIRLKPNYAAPHVHLGRVYVAMGKPADAETEFVRAVDIYPSDIDARKALGQFYLDSGRLKEAEEQFRASVAAAQDYPAWRALGEIYGRENRTGEEQDAWEHVLVFDPFSPEAHLALGRIYLAKGLYPDAQKEFDACLLMQPANKEALAGMGKLSELGQLRPNRATAR